MANTFINKGAALVTGGTDVYTCPGATAAIVNAIYISNIDGTNSADVDIKATIDGGSTYMHIAKPIPVPMCRECTSKPRCSKWNGKYPYEKI